MIQADIQRVFEKLDEMNRSLATIESRQTHVIRSSEDHECRIRDLTTWRDKQVGRMAIVSSVFGFLAALLGGWLVSLWKTG